MDEKIKSSFSEYKINYNPASSYLTGGTIQTSIPYAANQANNLSTKVDEMDLTTGLDKFNSTINNHNDIKVSEATILKIQIEEFNDTKVMIEEQLKELELKYNEFMVSGYKEGLIYENNICYNPDSLRASGYQLDIYLAEHGYDLNNSIEYQKGKEEFEKWIDEVYIPLFDKYFSEELGMTFEEYKELILALKDDLAIIKSSVYAYEQQEKLLPYLEIIETEEYKAYLESTEVPTIGTINSYFVMVQQEDLWLYNKLDAASEYLTEDDYYILKYLCDNKGIEHINAYLDAIEDRLNQSKGMVEAQAFIDSISTNGEIDLNLLTGALMAGKGIVDGIENFFEGLSNVFSTEGMISSNQYAQMYILEALGQEGIMDDTYQLGIGLGNMLPSIAISVLSQGALSGAGVGAGSASKVASVISSTSMGISSFGNDKNQGLIAGNDLYASTWHGIFTGLSETSLGLLLGNIPGLNSDASLSIKGLLSEGLEEGLQEYVGAGLNAAFYGEDIDISQLFGEGGKSFLYGMILSGFTNSTKLSFKVIANGKSVGVNANNFGAFISIMNDNNVGVTTLEDGTTTFIINSDTDVDSDLVSKMEGLFPSVAIIQQKNYGITNTIKETVVNSDIKFRTQIDGDSKEQSSHYLKTKVGSMEQPENITWGDIYNDPDITQPRVSVSSLLNIIKNPIEFKKSSTFENGIRKMDYYNYLVQLVDAVVKNDYDLDLSEQELGNLSELWHEALQVLPISCISYQEYLPDDIKLKLMLENGKIYNIEDVSILSKDFHEKFNSENFNSFPGTVLSDRFEVYLDLLIKYFENSSNTDLTDEILDFYYELLDIRKNCINLILEKKGDVSEANFTKFLSNIGISFNPNDGSMNISGFDSQMVLDYVNYYTKNSNYDINYTINPRELSLAQLMFWVNGGYIDGLPTVIDNIPTSRLLYALYEGYATIVDNGYGSAVASLYKIMQERGYEQILNDGALEVIKKVKKDRVQSIIDNYEQVPKTPDVQQHLDWANNVMISKLMSAFPNYMTSQRLGSLKNSIVYLINEDFELVEDSGICMGYNNGKKSVINTKYKDIKAITTHESLHQLSAKSKYYDSSTNTDIIKRGIKIISYHYSSDTKSVKFSGLNEALTEYFTEVSLGEDYPKVSYCGYEKAVIKLKEILKLNIEGLDISLLEKAYFENNPSLIAGVIDNIVGVGFFENTFAVAFDKAIKGNVEDLDVVVRILTEISIIKKLRN